MADVAHILRLMEHAADRLDEEEGHVRSAFCAKAESMHTGSERAAVMSDQASYFAAATYAATVLRMVASFMTDSEDTDHDG
jgi:uncharacterized membrane protein